MATAVIMPRQGQSVESCVIGQWYKQPGDVVRPGDLLFSYETDKAAFEEHAQVAGILLDVFFAAGDDVPCLTPVAAIGEVGESTAHLHPARNGTDAQRRPAGDGADMPAAAQATQPAGQNAGGPETPVSGTVLQIPEGTAAPASPRAKSLAWRSGAHLPEMRGSGPGGRVIERDVRQLLVQGPAEDALKGVPVRSSQTISLPVGETTPPAQPGQDEARVVRHSTIRKVIAQAMFDSLRNMAQLTLQSSFDAGPVMAWRNQLKETAAQNGVALPGWPAGFVPTLNDIILYAVCRCLPRHPFCNAHYDAEKTNCFNRVHLGFAVDTPRGLMVPTLFAADQMALPELAAAVKERAAACQSGTINPDLLKGATFTVSNLGMLGVESFTPVINPPQTCILGVCSIVERVRGNGGQLVTYPAIGLALTFDHRALDGAPAARFLQDLKSELERFPDIFY